MWYLYNVLLNWDDSMLFFPATIEIYYLQGYDWDSQENGELGFASVIFMDYGQLMGYRYGICVIWTEYAMGFLMDIDMETIWTSIGIQESNSGIQPADFYWVQKLTSGVYNQQFFGNIMGRMEFSNNGQLLSSFWFSWDICG